MKVICINKTPNAINHPILVAAFDKLIIGNMYNVLREVVGAYSEIDCYELEEFPCPISDNAIVFPANDFIPLSSIDETEMERNYKTEKQSE